jgi:hypothetical protein
VNLKRNLGAALAMLGWLCLPIGSHAATGFVKGTVEWVRIHDATVIPSWSPPRFWFSLNGVTSAGGCPAWVGGRVLFVSESKEAYNAVLIAQMTGKEIAVYWDDAQTVFWCRAGYITVGNQPPMF